MKKLTLVLVTFLAVSTTLAEEKIFGAFGVKLGEKFETSKAVSTNALGVGGLLLYEFKPESPFRSFTNYYAVTSPNSKRVCVIQARVEFDSLVTAQSESDVLLSILEAKYGKAEPENAMAKLKHQRKIKQGTRFIEIEIQDNPLKATLTLSYNDDELANQAYKEAIDNEVKKSDSKGL